MTACTGSVRCLAGAADCRWARHAFTASGLGQVLLAGLLPSGRASFGHRSGHRSKTACCLLFLASPRILQGRSFMAQRITTPKTKTRRYNKQSYGRCQAWGHDFLGHRFGWGPHRFACLSHPCRVSGPFLINLIALNSDGGSHLSIFSMKTKKLLLCTFLVLGKYRVDVINATVKKKQQNIHLGASGTWNQWKPTKLQTSGPTGGVLPPGWQRRVGFGNKRHWQYVFIAKKDKKFMYWFMTHWRSEYFAASCFVFHWG